jgi:hypothetical protein
LEKEGNATSFFKIDDLSDEEEKQIYSFKDLNKEQAEWNISCLEEVNSKKVVIQDKPWEGIQPTGTEEIWTKLKHVRAAITI